MDSKGNQTNGGSAYVRIGTPGFTSQTITDVAFVNKTTKQFEIPEMKTLEKKTLEKKEKPIKETVNKTNQPPTTEVVEEDSIPILWPILGGVAVLAVAGGVVLVVFKRRRMKKVNSDSKLTQL